MKFTQLFSGSTGNAYIVESGSGGRLLIECGVTPAEHIKALKYNWRNIEACLISHSHMDHCKGVVAIVKSCIDIYASAGAIEDMWKYCNGFIPSSRHVHACQSGKLLKLNHFQVIPFDTIHDKPEPLGFVVRDNHTGEFMLFCTDTKCIVPKFPYPFSIIAIEASYCGETLARKEKSGEINSELAKRLLDNHMEIKETARYLREFCDLSKCHEIHLLHISGQNNDRERCRKRFEDEFLIDVITV